MMLGAVETFGVAWDEPLFLLALLVLPLLVWRVVSRGAKGRVPVPNHAPLIAVGSARAALWWLPDALRVLGIVALVVTLARPRVAGAEVQAGEGVDILLALDMSASMNAIDLPKSELERMVQAGTPVRNRFEIARDVLKQLVVERHKEAHDRIGLVVFGGNAWLRYPLTHDHARLVRTLNELVLDDGHQDRHGRCTNACTVPGNGTAIGDALGRGYNQLRRAKGDQDKIVILITDGKEEGGTLKAQAIARHIRDLPPEERVRVYTFLVGNKVGGDVWLPVTRRLRGAQSQVVQYERPARAFETDPALLEEIAAATGGKYYESYSEEKFEQDIGDLKRVAF
ncbi:MAG: VWA domain-containing protein, partial [Deltaproteobacteria bacterium]|nr:VWA domain-containing protein [Deltaproteobacteria bacterium]